MPDASTILPAVLLAVVPSLVYLVVLNAIDRYEKEPWTILLACLGVGAVVAPAIAIGGPRARRAAAPRCRRPSRPAPARRADRHRRGGRAAARC